MIPDFSTYTDHELESAFSRIDKERFEATYQNCKAEIEKRRHSGAWMSQPERLEAERSSPKLLRLFISIQLFGALAGLWSNVRDMFTSYLYGSGPIVVSVEILNWAITGLFIWTAWMSYLFLSRKRDVRFGLKASLALQTISVSSFAFSFSFYCGTRVLLFFLGNRIGWSAFLGSKALISWGVPSSRLGMAFSMPDDAFGIGLNLVALATLVLLFVAPPLKVAQRTKS